MRPERTAVIDRPSAVSDRGFADVDALEERLSRPDADVVADLAELDGDFLILGAGGKIGPTLTRMAKRAAPNRQVFAIARYSNRSLIGQFKQQGIEPIEADLLDPAAIASLPAAKNVILMTGYKFGASNDPAKTWAVNTLLPANISASLKQRRLLAFSTGCVDPSVPIESGGAAEDYPLTTPGEYANSCVARERAI